MINVTAIVDYGMCNLDSIRRAVEECGGCPLVTDQPHDLEISNRIILPGVGAFPEAMENLHQRGLFHVLREQVLDKQIPFLGICLGMQLMASKGLEFGETEGLGLIAGKVQRLEPYGEDTRIPHVGWNEVHPVRPSVLFNAIESGKDFYFVHSFHLVPDREEDVLARTPYGPGIVSAIQHDLIFGVQFHPEKSQRMGFQVLRNFLTI